MIGLDQFQQTAESAALVLGDRSAINLSADGNGLVVRSGVLASRTVRFRTAENRAVERRFAESLRSSYGDEVAEAALSFGLSRRFGKPLRARNVQRIIDLANYEQRQIGRRNREVLERYCRPTEQGGATDRLSLEMKAQARKRFPSQQNPDRLLNPDRIARMARDEIVAAGQGGTHRVTEREAFDIVARVVDRELDAKADVLERLDAGRGDSIAGLALTEAARNHPQLRFDPQRLTANAVSQLNRRFTEALENGKVPDERLSDGDALGALARDLVEEFIGERLAAVRAVESLRGEPCDHEALRTFAAHGDISPALASAMAGAYPSVRSELVELGGRLEGAALERAIVELRNAVMQALDDAAVADGIADRDAVRSCWGFLLAAGGEPLAHSIAGRIAGTGSALGAVGAGIDWFLNDFLPSEEGQRLSTEPQATRNGLPICGIEEYSQAFTLSHLLNALAEAVQDSGAAGERQCGFGKRSAERLRDADIAVLRNLGIPIPAPDRSGTGGGQVLVSRTTLAEVQNGIARQIDRKDDHHTVHGVLEDSYMEFDDAALKIDGDWLRQDRLNAVKGLNSVCLNRDGTPNMDLLRTVSIMTNRETLSSIHRACFNSRRPDVSVFRGRPVLEDSQPVFDLEDDGEGNVYLDIEHTGEVKQLEIDRANGSINGTLLDPDRSYLRTVVRIFIDGKTCQPELERVVVSYNLSPLVAAKAVADAGGHHTAAPIPPVPADASAGRRLHPGFDRVGAIARLDQEIALQSAEIQQSAAGDPDSPDRARMEAELGARLLSRSEISAGRDPRHALRSRVAELTGRYGAGDSRTGAFQDTLNYFENAGGFASARTVSPDSLSPAQRQRLISDWRDRLFGMRDVVNGQRPRSVSRVERAQVLADSESYVQQAIVSLSTLRDPMPELMRHARELEERQLSDGDGAFAEATILRTMAREYAQLQ